MKIWTGKLKLKALRNKEGSEVEAQIIVSASGSIVFEVREILPGGPDVWRTCDPDEIHAASWLRALGETGQAIGLPAKGAA